MACGGQAAPQARQNLAIKNSLLCITGLGTFGFFRVKYSDLIPNRRARRSAGQQVLGGA
jgi:hypothetical protein